jgi:uncharacterized cofD-like protein
MSGAGDAAPFDRPVSAGVGAASWSPSPRHAVLKLLYPGLGVKRWLLLGATGISLCSIGLAFLMRKLFSLGFPDFLPLYLEGVFMLVLGVAVLALAVYGLYRSVGPLVLASKTIDGLADAIYTRRSREKGPRIVVIGGGTGLSRLLRGMKAHTDNLTAVVSVGDNGGSSGRLRDELGVPPPGDFRNCLVALSDSEPLVRELFQYRFDRGNGLRGHSFGNLFIVAMTDITQNFEEALSHSSKVLAVRGDIIPATAASLTLSAELKDGAVVHGESQIGESGGAVERLMIEPADARASLSAVDAIRDSDVVVLGPGSLYTSVLPNLLVGGITEALKKSESLKIYVCNVATQKGETDGYRVEDHLEAIQAHTFDNIVDYVIANSRPIDFGDRFLGETVVSDGRPVRHAKIVFRDVIDTAHPVGHDSANLARSIIELYNDNS